MLRKLIWAGILSAIGMLIWRNRLQREQFSIRDKVIVVTGASGDIGRAICHAFAAQGGLIVLTGRQPATLHPIAAEIEAQYGVDTLVVPADVTVDSDLQRLVQTVEQHFGRIDVLVNQASDLLGGPLEELNPRRVRDLLYVNLVGAIRLTQLVLPGMLKRRHGHIVNVSSMVSLICPPGMAVYAGSRLGINAFSDSLRRELHGTGVNVSYMMPGWTRNTTFLRVDEDDMRESGILNPLIYVDPPAVVAQGIVDAVRFNRAEVLFGGPLVTVGATFARIFPGLYDLYYDHIGDRTEMLHVFRQMGWNE
ncbi:MAG: SDR family oxidoreductase [Phototrophicales bacterium]|nr:MAG: hypothetical protein CUN56_02745 [Phototrophicales bacterium]RMG71233.1 MAG: SDR family NAD(P)-dependent oxidoreductase [Chloroflexota bacterium]